MNRRKWPVKPWTPDFGAQPNHRSIFSVLQLFLISCLIAQHDIRYHNLLLIEIDYRVEHSILMQALQIC